jgi:enamine deaminase RidA (YjgF/YER057c/UK114 family)
MAENDIKRIAGNPRMSSAVVHGATIYISGQVAIDAGGQDVTTQTREILARIDALLAHAGSDKSRLLSVNLLLADIATLPEVNALWDKWLAPGCAPARTTIQTILASPRYALEIAVIAATAPA